MKSGIERIKKIERIPLQTLKEERMNEGKGGNKMFQNK